jgi:phosphomannomutase
MLDILNPAMSTISHPATGFSVGDPEALPFSEDGLPSPARVAAAASSLILSASGWRKIFAEGGDEESPTEKVEPADLVLAGAAAMAFAGFLRERSLTAPGGGHGEKGRSSPAVLVGIDSRPTGPAIADAMIRVFIGLGLEARYLFIVAAPEIMAYAGGAGATAADGDRAAGFCYISASHNPRGHNGIKFGMGGGVLGGADSAALIDSYRRLLAEAGLPARVLAAMEAAEPREVARAFSSCSAWKRRSVSAYTLFSREVVSGTADSAAQEKLFDEMAAAAAARPVGVVAELNGSARCLSIDRDFLEGLGVAVRTVNDKPRAFAHRIVPEGESLDQARRELGAARAEDGAFALAYVPDCDGDRGNLVAALRSGEVRALEAQEVFALACVAELSGLARSGAFSYGADGSPRAKVAVVVNDATSMRIEAICRAFGAECRRSETGEANVVGLAASLRAEGYVVRILGEGSNGGNITHPSRVRDPLATVAALLKLLLLRGGATAGGGATEPGLFETWLKRSGRDSEYRPDFGMDEILASLPEFATTSVFESRAALRIASADQAALKARYAEVFLREWEEKKDELERRFGVVSWEALSTKGQVEERLGDDTAGADFAASGRGGLRILLSDREGRPRAFLWMRGSGTEPVFRVMADLEGGAAEDEAWLLDWQVSMLRAADAAAAAAH